MKLLGTFNGVSCYHLPAEFTANNQPRLALCWQSLLEYFADKQPSSSKGVEYEYLVTDMFQHYLSDCNVNQWVACDFDTFRRCMERLDYEIEYSEKRGAEVVYTDIPDEYFI